MSVERDIRFDLIARLCPNTTGAELRSVATEVSISLLLFNLFMLIGIGGYVCNPRKAKGGVRTRFFGRG